MSSYRMRREDGTIQYRRQKPRAVAGVNYVPDVSSALLDESEMKRPSVDEGPIQYGRPRNDSSHLGRFAYRPVKRKLYVLFASARNSFTKTCPVDCSKV